MIYSLDLKTAFLLIGLLLVLGHAVALLRPRATQDFLRALPRSKPLGMLLLALATIWAWLLVRHIDLGEFTNWRPRLLILIPIAAWLTWQYVHEFLAARALGMLTLLAAEPLLEAAFLRPETSRLLLVTLVYVWIFLGLFWIGMPYTLRDQIGWVSKSESRWKTAAVAGLSYGALLLILLPTLRHSA